MVLRNSGLASGRHRRAADPGRRGAGGGVGDRRQRGSRAGRRHRDRRGPGQQGAAEQVAGARAPARFSARFARCCSRRRISRWSAGIPANAAGISTNWPPCAGPASRRFAPTTRRCSEQRTALLKSAAGGRFRGDRGVLDTLDVWDGQLAAHGAELMAARIELVNLLAPEVEKAYQLLAPASRPAAISYRSSVEVVAGRRRGRRSSWRRPCWPGWPAAGTPNWTAVCAWSARTATIWSCGWAISRRKASPATVSRGRWRCRCGWRRTSCCAPRAANRC